jgi:hypothetical protein
VLSKAEEELRNEEDARRLAMIAERDNKNRVKV